MRLLDVNNPIMGVLNKVFDIFFLSLIYMVFCVPVVTAGAATTSLYYVSAKVIRHSRSYVWREFWHSFKLNFKKSTIFWIILVVIYILLWWNINFLGLSDSKSTQYGGYLSGIYLAMMLIVACIASYVFPVISRFEQKFTMTVRFCMYLAFRHILHTICNLILLLAAGFLIYLGVGTSFVVLVALIPGLFGFLYTFPIEHVLKKYMPRSDNKTDEDGNIIKEWYEE